MSVTVADQGAAIRVLDNKLTIACSLHPGIARGWITYVSDGEVTFFFIPPTMAAEK